MNQRNLEMKSKQKVLKFRYREVFFFIKLVVIIKEKETKLKKIQKHKAFVSKKKCWP